MGWLFLLLALYTLQKTALMCAAADLFGVREIICGKLKKVPGTAGRILQAAYPFIISNLPEKKNLNFCCRNILPNLPGLRQHWGYTLLPMGWLFLPVRHLVMK